MNFIYCDSCHEEYSKAWPELEDGYLVGFPLSLCVHLACREDGGNAWGIKGTRMLNSRVCFVAPIPLPDPSPPPP